MADLSKPQDPSTISHWIASNTGPSSLHNYGKDESIPESADIVIVGAGISGAMLAYHLTHPEDDKHALPEGTHIVILEANEVSSSATGRNGGHFAPSTFVHMPRLVRPVGKGGAGLSRPQAVNILQHEWDNYQRNIAVIKKHGLEHKVDLHTGKAMAVYTTEKALASTMKIREDWLAALKEMGVEDWSDGKFYTDKEEAIKLSRVQGAIGCSTRSAGTVHPHKLTTELLKLSLGSTKYKVTLRTSAPVTKLSQSGSTHTVETSRGSITASKVVLCTNAHTPHLFPAGHPFSKIMYPVRIQMGLFTPPPAFSGIKSLSASYGFPDGYCATSAGGIVVGVGAADYLEAKVGKPQDYICQTDISQVTPEATKFMTGYMEKTFVDWKEKAHGEGLTRSWTGVMSYTTDLLPLIGPLPGVDGLYVSVGYNGHGMSTTHTTNRALARLIASEEWDQDFPTAYVVSEERLNRQHAQKFDDYVKIVAGNKLAGPPSEPQLDS